MTAKLYSQIPYFYVLILLAMMKYLACGEPLPEEKNLLVYL